MADQWDAGAQAAYGQPDPGQTRYDALTLRLLSLAELEAMPPQTFLIDKYLIRNSLAWIGGKPRNYKSFVAVEMACCVGTGTNWHGHKVQKGKVLYLVAEGVAGVAKRFRAWSDYHGVPITDVTFLPMPLRLAEADSDDVIAFARVIREGQYDLVILDTQARVTTGADENSSKDMGQFVDVLSKLKDQYGSTMLVIHHEPRNATNLRGSIALEGGADTILRCAREGKSNQVTIEMSKQKDAEELEELLLSAKTVGESMVLEEMDPTDFGKSTTGNEQKVLDALLNWPGFEAPSGELLEVSEVPKNSYYRTLKKLISKGQVAMREVGRSKYYSIPEGRRPAPHAV